MIFNIKTSDMESLKLLIQQTFCSELKDLLLASSIINEIDVYRLY